MLPTFKVLPLKDEGVVGQDIVLQALQLANQDPAPNSFEKVFLNYLKLKNGPLYHIYQTLEYRPLSHDHCDEKQIGIQKNLLDFR